MVPLRISRVFPLQSELTHSNLRPSYLRLSTRARRQQSGLMQESQQASPANKLQSLPLLSPHTITSTTKISSRSAQIARHFSDTSSPTSIHTTEAHPDTNMASKYGVRKIGAPNTLEHRIYIEKDGIPVSPFHDIPLYANEQQTILNMVVEIPRWTNGKLEVRFSQITAIVCHD